MKKKAKLTYVKKGAGAAAKDDKGTTTAEAAAAAAAPAKEAPEPKPEVPAEAAPARASLPPLFVLFSFFLSSLHLFVCFSHSFVLYSTLL